MGYMKAQLGDDIEEGILTKMDFWKHPERQRKHWGVRVLQVHDRTDYLAAELEKDPMQRERELPGEEPPLSAKFRRFGLFVFVMVLALILLFLVS
jgi:hypothetical protein